MVFFHFGFPETPSDFRIIKKGMFNLNRESDGAYDWCTVRFIFKNGFLRTECGFDFNESRFRKPTLSSCFHLALSRNVQIVQIVSVSATRVISEFASNPSVINGDSYCLWIKVRFLKPCFFVVSLDNRLIDLPSDILTSL